MMIAELTMIATQPVDEAAVQKLREEGAGPGESRTRTASGADDFRAQQPEPPHPTPGQPASPEQPVVPPDDPHRTDVEREPSIDPPPTEPPVSLPSEKPGITEPPRPRA